MLADDDPESGLQAQHTEDAGGVTSCLFQDVGPAGHAAVPILLAGDALLASCSNQLLDFLHRNQDASGLKCHTQNHVSRLGACRVSAEALCLFDATCEGPALVVPVRLSPGDRKQVTLSLELGPKLRDLLPKLSSLRTFFSHRDRQLER